jgi:hypothetical protein
MNNDMAKDAIMDAIANRRLAKQPDDAGLEEALEIILTPITEYPDVQHLIIQISQLQAENKRLKESIEAALRISDLWTLKEVETMFEDEAKALAIMKTRFEKVLTGL